MVVGWLWMAVALADCPVDQRPEAYEVQPDASEEDVPGRPVLVDIGFSVQIAGGGCEDCADALLIDLDLGGTENGLAADEVGYLLKVIDGALPEEVVLPETPFQGPAASFVYLLERSTLGEDLAVQIELRAVSASGVVSQQSLVVDVRAEGAPPIALGCSQVPAPGGSAAACVALALYAGRRRLQPRS